MRQKRSSKATKIILTSSGIEESNPTSEYDGLSDEELKKAMYPEMFAGEQNLSQNDKSHDQTKTDSQILKNDKTITIKNSTKSTKNVKPNIKSNVYTEKENNKEIRENINEEESEPSESVIERYEDLMIDSRIPLNPGEFRYLGNEDRFRLTGSNNSGSIYLYNIPNDRLNLHGYTLYVFDGSSWRLIPHRGNQESEYAGVSNRLRGLGYQIGGRTTHQQDWHFTRNTTIDGHNHIGSSNAAHISIMDRNMPSNLFKLVYLSGNDILEYNFEYDRGSSNLRNNGIDIPIDFFRMRQVPEFSQISRYQGAKGLESSSLSFPVSEEVFRHTVRRTYAYGLTMGLITGLLIGAGTIHFLNKNKTLK